MSGRAGSPRRFMERGSGRTAARPLRVDVGSQEVGCRGVCVPAVELKSSLEQYVHRRYPGLVRIVRNSRREGLIRARLQGWKAATAPVVGFFDAHVEFSTGW